MINLNELDTSIDICNNRQKEIVRLNKISDLESKGE